MSDYGIDSASASLRSLIQGEYEVQNLAIDATKTTPTVVGQVVQYDASGNNYIDVADANASHYGVILEVKTISGDTYAQCLIAGKVLLTALDSTTQANPDILAKLKAQGIIPVSNGTV